MLQVTMKEAVHLYKFLCESELEQCHTCGYLNLSVSIRTEVPEEPEIWWLQVAQ